MRKFATKNLNIDLQVFGLRSLAPYFTPILISRPKTAVWLGELQPTPLSKKYKVRIEYAVGDRPQVTLPEEDFGKKRPPHTFEGNRLCLYHRFGLGAWNGGRHISELIPMISHWLWCYEIWKVTGRKKWPGEEYPHNTDAPKENH